MDVHITGSDLPDWATEMTQSQIATTLANQFNVDKDQAKKLSFMIKNGDKLNANVAKTNGLLQQNIQQEAKGIREDKKADAKQAGILEGILNYGRINNELQKKRQDNNQSMAIAKLMKDGLSKEDATYKAKVDSLVEGAKEGAAFMGKAAVGITAASEGFNAFLGQQFEDRFNLANEIRQSGLMAGFDATTAGLEEMSRMISANNFTLGEAAEFTKRFSRSVGIVGVESALKFASTMADSQGADMMTRFGMEFGQVTNVAGEYLDSLRNMGVLDRMSQQQMRDGMEDFMSGVTSTANVLKINLEEAAKMMSQTLQRDDVSALLATMDPERAANIRQTIGSAGMLEGALGEAVIKRMAAGSESAFLVEEIRNQLASNAAGQNLLPIVEKLAQAGELGPEQFQEAVANMGSEISGVVDYITSNSALRLDMQNNPFIAKMVSDLSRLSGTIESADDGMTPMADSDQQQIRRQEITRRGVVGMETILNEQMPAFGDNLAQLNTANESLLESSVQLGISLTSTGVLAQEAATEVAVLARKGGELLTEAGTLITDKIVGPLSEFAAGVVGNVSVKNAGEAVEGIDPDAKIETKKEGEEALDNVRGGSDTSGFFFESNSRNIFQDLKTALESKGQIPASEVAEQLLSRIDTTNMFGSDEDLNMTNLGVDVAAALNEIKNMDIAQGENTAGTIEMLQKILEATQNQKLPEYYNLPGRDEDAMRERDAEAQNILVNRINALINELQNN